MPAEDLQLSVIRSILQETKAILVTKRRWNNNSSMSLFMDEQI